MLRKAGRFYERMVALLVTLLVAGSGLAAGNSPAGTIRHIDGLVRVYHDLNGNGLRDGGEPGLPGWEIHIINADTGEDRHVTTEPDSVDPDANGTVSFSLDEGQRYFLCETMKPRWGQTAPSNGHDCGTHSASAGPNGFDTDGPAQAADFGNAEVPHPPTNVVARAGNHTASVTWTPGADGGSPITAFIVTSSPDGKTIAVDSNTTQASVTGLRNGVTYTFTVVATNAVGASDHSAPSNPVTPATIDGHPEIDQLLNQVFDLLPVPVPTPT